MYSSIGARSSTLSSILFYGFHLIFILLASVQRSDAQLGSVNGKVNLERPEVALSYCTVRGTEYLLSTGIKQPYRLLAFIGVPYAMPPIGADRFGVSSDIIILDTHKMYYCLTKAYLILEH